uniref:MYND-type domain-containing protein n=1 Tax=Moniliophthora roreri TaxID=221103 RepID=A0A0W0FDX7_MONRR
MRDSQIALDKLGQRVEESPEILPKILPVLFHHLESTPPSSFRANGKVRLAHAALRALYRATITDPEISDRSARMRIGDNWATIWTWLSFMISYILLENSTSLEDLTFREDVEFTCAELTDRFLRIPDLCRFMLNTENFIELVTYFRLLDTQLSSDSLSCLNNIFRTLQRSANDWSCWQQRCLKVLDSRPSDAVNAFLGSIMRISTSPEEIEVATLSSNLLMIIHFTTLSPKLHLAFVRHRSVAWMACLMYRLVLAPYESSGAVIGFMKGCISYIRSTIQSHGYRCVVEALENGILTSMLKAKEYMIRDKESRLTVAGDQYLQDQCVGLLRIIGCYSAYGVVLKALKKAIGKAEKEKWYVQVVRGLPMPVKEAWILIENIKILRMDDKMKWRSGGFNICANESCPSPRKDYFGPMYRCSGCLVSIYCSRECQRTCWKEGSHRSFCKAAESIRREGRHSIYGSADQLDTRQSAFQMWEMQVDSQRQVELISSASPVTHAIKLDYRDIPIKVGLLTLEECKTEDQGDYPPKDWEYYMNGGHIQDFGADGILVYAIFPHGGSRRYSLLKFFPRE